MQGGPARIAKRDKPAGQGDNAMSGEPSGAGALDTFPKLLLDNARRFGDRPAIREKDLGIWNAITWSQYHGRVRQFALSMRQLGLVQGDVVALIGDNPGRKDH